ncbi:hypothetical protein ABN224_16925 [Providencia rettgeri]
MKREKCIDCGKDLKQQEKNCSSCGSTDPHFFTRMKKWEKIEFIIYIFLFFFCFFYGSLWYAKLSFPIKKSYLFIDNIKSSIL